MAAFNCLLAYALKPSFSKESEFCSTGCKIKKYICIIPLPILYATIELRHNTPWCDLR